MVCVCVLILLKLHQSCSSLKQRVFGSLILCISISLIYVLILIIFPSTVFMFGFSFYFQGTQMCFKVIYFSFSDILVQPFIAINWFPKAAFIISHRFGYYMCLFSLVFRIFLNFLLYFFHESNKCLYHSYLCHWFLALFHHYQIKSFNFPIFTKSFLVSYYIICLKKVSWDVEKNVHSAVFH